jgi:hypothetical protein
MSPGLASRFISISQRGLSGIGRRRRPNTTDGAMPVANIHRQPGGDEPRLVAVPGDEVVDERGRRDPDHDRDLVHRHHPPADLGRA